MFTQQSDWEEEQRKVTVLSQCIFVQVTSRFSLHQGSRIFYPKTAHRPRVTCLKTWFSAFLSAEELQLRI